MTHFTFRTLPPRPTVSARKIPATVTILDLLAIFPSATEILEAYGLACATCIFGGTETLEEGCRSHGFSPAMTKALLQDLNRMLLSTVVPTKDCTMTVTDGAREEMQRRMKEEKDAKGLRVQLDGQGRFCMEFQPKPARGDRVIRQKKASFSLFVPPLLIAKLNGATIDFREGGFQLDLA